MWARSELQALTHWCEANHIRWMPSAAEAGQMTMLLEGDHRRRNWKRMLLTLNEEGFCLLTEEGEPVAESTELVALLDALNDSAARPAPAAPQGPSFRRPVMERTLSFVL